MKLTDFTRLIGSELGDKDLRFGCTSADDIFNKLVFYGFKEIEVTKEEMAILVIFYLANIGNDKNGKQREVLREGKIDKFFGINLIEKREL